MLPSYTDPSYLLDKLSCFRNDDDIHIPGPLMNFEERSNLNESHQEMRTTTKRRKQTRNDRHSKIYTAHGLRDRRMRLSVEVARKFFALQDMLGFDKASTTVNWLLTQSKSAIEQHVSDFEERAGISVVEAKEEVLSNVEKGSPSLLSRGSRAEARARARERTKEKKKRREEEELLYESRFSGGHGTHCEEISPMVIGGESSYSIYSHGLDF